MGAGAVAGIVGFLVARGDDDGLDTTAAATELRSLAGAVQVPAGDTSVTLSGSCPFGHLTGISATAPSGVHLDGDFGDDFVLAVPGESADPMLFQCTRSTSDGESFYGLLVGTVPKGSFSEYVDRSVESFGTTRSKSEQSHLGGTIVQYCIDFTEGNGGSCESDWTNGEIQIGLFASDATPQATTEWLKARLPKMISDLNEFKADEVDVTSQS